MNLFYLHTDIIDGLLSFHQCQDASFILTINKSLRPGNWFKIQGKATPHIAKRQRFLTFLQAGSYQTYDQMCDYYDTKVYMLSNKHT